MICWPGLCWEFLFQISLENVLMLNRIVSCHCVFWLRTKVLSRLCFKYLLLLEIYQEVLLKLHNVCELLCLVLLYFVFEFIVSLFISNVNFINEPVSLRTFTGWCELEVKDSWMNWIIFFLLIICHCCHFCFHAAAVITVLIMSCLFKTDFFYRSMNMFSLLQQSAACRVLKAICTVSAFFWVYPLLASVTGCWCLVWNESSL